MPKAINEQDILRLSNKTDKEDKFDEGEVMKKFDETGAWNLPVLNEGKYIGFISKSSIFVQYRNRLIKTTSE